MARAVLRRLRVTGTGKAPAEIDFGPTLTFITGASNTGKSHIFGCIDFVLGGSVPERDFTEARGYDRVLLELASGNDVVTVRRSFGREDIAEWFAGPIDEWDDEQVTEVPVKVDRAKPRATLGGRLLDAVGFDAADVLVANAKGKTQALSLRTLSHLFRVSEEEVITVDSPVAPPSFGQTAARSGFNLMLSGRPPSEHEIATLRQANQDREQAAQHVAVLDPIIEGLRAEIADAGTRRDELDAELASIDEQLGQLSEMVAASGDQVRGLITRRNDALKVADEARGRAVRARVLRSRFQLLAQHYETDVQRLEFALESGHFFGQLAASHCPRCGRPLPDNEECHPETADFAAIERASRAEIKKLTPRINDLQKARADVQRDAERAGVDEERARQQAATLDEEIRHVANPTAADARQRVRRLADRRREVEHLLLRHRELDRYLATRQEADLAAKHAVDSFRPVPDAASLRSLQQHVSTTLQAWRFPVRSDVIYDAKTDDIVVDGKPRAANGKGVRAVMHAAFTVGLMRHCFAADTPHPGFVVVDSPLTPFRGADNDEDEDEEMRADVHAATLQSLAATAGKGQTIIMENIDPPAGLHGATVHVFTGQAGRGRSGFYPV